MKRILIFSVAYVPYVGGAELAVKEITDRLDPKEHTFDMVTLRFDSNLPERELIGNVTVHRIGFTAHSPRISDRTMPLVCKISKLLFPFTAYLKARSLHRAKPYDAVWALMAGHAGFGALFFKLANPGIPYLLELQDGTPLEKLKARPLLQLLWPLYRNIYLKADAVKVISHFIERLARGVGYTGPLHVIPNGVDTARFSASIAEEKLLALKARFEKRMGDIFLFTASRLVLSRGVEDIIRSLTHLPLEVKLLIAGDGEDREKLERIAKEVNVAGRVMFAGHVGHDELPAYLKISDIFVRPSVIEGMGSAFIEAFAAGIPVVATPVGGIPDFLVDGDTGVFCNVRDPESVAHAVNRYLEDPALVARVVKKAKDLAKEKYDWGLIARDMREKIFDKLV